jgi:hypothetical protein
MSTRTDSTGPKVLYPAGLVSETDDLGTAGEQDEDRATAVVTLLAIEFRDLLARAWLATRFAGVAISREADVGEGAGAVEVRDEPPRQPAAFTMSCPGHPMLDKSCASHGKHRPEGLVGGPSSRKHEEEQSKGRRANDEDGGSSLGIWRGNIASAPSPSNLADGVVAPCHRLCSALHLGTWQQRSRDWRNDDDLRAGIHA